MRETAILDGGYIAEVALAEGAGVIFSSTANGYVKYPTADGQKIAGVVQFAVDAGEQVTLRKAGISRLLTSGAFAAGDELIVTASTGAFKKADTELDETHYIAAIAEEANGASDTVGFGDVVTYAKTVVVDATLVRAGEMHVAANADPSANNDGVDTATLGKKFNVGAFWVNNNDDGFFVCGSNATGAATWVEFSPTTHTHS